MASSVVSTSQATSLSTGVRSSGNIPTNAAWTNTTTSNASNDPNKFGLLVASKISEVLKASLGGSSKNSSLLGDKDNGLAKSVNLINTGLGEKGELVKAINKMDVKLTTLIDTGKKQLALLEKQFNITAQSIDAQRKQLRAQEAAQALANRQNTAISAPSSNTVGGSSGTTSVGGGGLTGLGGALLGGALGALGALFSGGSVLGGALGGAAGGALGSPILGALLGTAFSKPIEKLGKYIGKTLKNLGSMLWEGLKWTGNWIWGKATAWWNKDGGGKDIAKKVGQAIWDLEFKGYKVGDVLTGIWNAVKPIIDIFKWIGGNPIKSALIGVGGFLVAELGKKLAWAGLKKVASYALGKVAGTAVTTAVTSTAGGSAATAAGTAITGTALAGTALIAGTAGLAAGAGYIGYKAIQSNRERNQLEEEHFGRRLDSTERNALQLVGGIRQIQFNEHAANPMIRERIAAFIKGGGRITNSNVRSVLGLSGQDFYTPEDRQPGGRLYVEGLYGHGAIDAGDGDGIYVPDNFDEHINRPSNLWHQLITHREGNTGLGRYLKVPPLMHVENLPPDLRIPSMVNAMNNEWAGVITQHVSAKDHFERTAGFLEDEVGMAGARQFVNDSSIVWLNGLNAARRSDILHQRGIRGSIGLTTASGEDVNVGGRGDITDIAGLSGNTERSGDPNWKGFRYTDSEGNRYYVKHGVKTRVDKFDDDAEEDSGFLASILGGVGGFISNVWNKASNAAKGIGSAIGRTVSKNMQGLPFHGERGTPGSIVFHHTAGGSLQGNIDYLKSGADGRNVGYHYLIGRDGRVVNLASDRELLWHVGDNSLFRRISNRNAIGIAAVANNDGDITPAQTAAGVQLASDLQRRYGIPASMVRGHGQVSKDKQETEGRALMREFSHGAIAAGDGDEMWNPVPNEIPGLVSESSTSVGRGQSVVINQGDTYVMSPQSPPVESQQSSEAQIPSEFWAFLMGLNSMPAGVFV